MLLWGVGGDSVAGGDDRALPVFALCVTLGVSPGNLSVKSRCEGSRAMHMGELGGFQGTVHPPPSPSLRKTQGPEAYLSKWPWDQC